MTPALKDYLWGGRRLHELFGRENGGNNIAESWEISVHPDGPSKCNGGTLADYIGAFPGSVNRHRDSLPILIKYIDAKQNLSVQVHPDDEYAHRVERDNGKTEMWYILKAEEGAGIYCGFKRDTSRDEFFDAVKQGEVEKLLNFIRVQEGDCFLIEAGTVHAICAGCVICEVQQSSNVTYRVYDYNRRDAKGNMRELHLEKALDVINYRAFEDNTSSGAFVPCAGGRIRKLTECKFFRCRELLLKGVYCESADNSFRTLNILDGNGEIDGIVFSAGDSFFVPCGERFTVCGEAKIIITDEGRV